MYGDLRDRPHGRRLAERETMLTEIKHPMTSTEKEEVQQMLYRNQQSFMLEGEKLGRTDLVKHDIKTTTDKPIRQPPRRFPIHQREEGEKQVQEMLKNEIIELSSSPWASPVVLVKKKDNSIRFCIDYRRLNEVTVKDSYPLPRIDSSLDALSGSSCFSTLDLASGYWQVGLSEEAKEKSAFITNSGLFQSWSHVFWLMQCTFHIRATHGSGTPRFTVADLLGVSG